MSHATPEHTSASHLDCAQVVAAIRSVLPGCEERVALHEPWFAGNEWEYVRECIDTGWVSSAGKFVDRLERMLAEYTGVARAVAVTNGTAALHMCLKLVGVDAGDEVLIPTLTFVATANAVSYCAAMPHFVDSEEATLGLDAAKLDAYLADIADVHDGRCFNRRTGARIAAIVPMHTFGFPVDLDAVAGVCRRFSIPMIEDAAESLGSLYKGKHTGTFGVLGALSFNGNKIVTTGGGGAILTNDPDLGAMAKHLSTTARETHRWTLLHNQVGYNYRMPNLNAALGCAQLEQLPRFLQHKRNLAGRYRQALESVDGVRFMVEPSGTKSNYWLNCLLVQSGQVEDRDLLLAATNDSGIMTRPSWKLMHTLPMYTSCPRMDLSVAEKLEAAIINIPSSAFLDSGRG
jgi:perosamine synthetase